MVPIRQVTSSVLSSVLGRQPLSPAKVSFAWQTSGGAALARATRVALRTDGTLDVMAASRHWAQEVDRSRGVLLERMAALLGSDVIRRIAVVGSSVRERFPNRSEQG